MPTTRQCCGVSAVAATTRAEIETISSVLNDERLSHDLLGVSSATEYFASELLAFENACAPADAAVAHTRARASNTRIVVPFCTRPWPPVPLAREYTMRRHVAQRIARSFRPDWQSPRILSHPRRVDAAQIIS